MREAAATVPHFGLGADIIVGFPGETDEEFEETRRMVEELPFSYLHVFRFSPRPETAAADMPDQVHHATITKRSEILRKLADEKQAEFACNLVGTVREAVVETESGDPNWRQATTDNYVTILVPNSNCPAGTLIEAQISDYRDGKLYATVARELNTILPTGTGD